MTEEIPVPTQEEPVSDEREPSVLRGTPVAPGFAMGPAHRKEYDLDQVPVRRVPRDGIERELNRFHRALADSREQLEGLKDRLRGKVPVDHARILDTHVAYLKDSVFLSDVENLILNEQMSLEAAIAKVIGDFDRIFRLVESEILRERAVDLRDVGIRVLRNLELGEDEDGEGPDVPEDYVLVARELSIVDMFNLSGDHVLGILTEGGSLTSHAAILARSMRIPTVTGVVGLLDDVAEGDVLIVDASEGIARVRPEERIREQYRVAQAERASQHARRPANITGGVRTADGQEVQLTATCGNLPEAEHARELGVASIGLYRTELLYLVDREQPSLDSLVAHYRSVLDVFRGSEVTFRLLDVDSSMQLPYLHAEREQNPGLGRLGVRALLANENVLRRQLQAILRAPADLDGEVRLRVAVPKVLDCGELRRVKEILFEERFALKKAGIPGAGTVPVGVVLETPASAIGVEDLADEADFLAVGLDSFQQYLLAADRGNGDLARYFEHLHPYVLRMLARIVAVVREAGKSLGVFGMTATAKDNVPDLIGVGLRSFAAAPVAVEGFVEVLAAVDAGAAKGAVDAGMRVACPSERDPVIPGYGPRFRPN